MEPETQDADVEKFAKPESRRFNTLTVKVAAGIAKACTGELGRQIHQYCWQQQTKHSRAPKGRKPWCMVLQYYTTSEKVEIVYALRDLSSVK